MSDWQRPPQGYPPQPAPGYAPPPQGYPPPKKRTGLIIAVVVIALLLLCCCSVGVAVLLFRSDSSTTTTTTTASPEELAKKKAEEEELAKRATEWKKVQAALVRGDYAFAEPDERQRRLAEAAVAQLLPDFTMDELTIEPGYYDQAKKFYVFDGVFMTLHLTSDPAAKTAYSFDLETPAAEASGMSRDKLDLDENDAVIQLEGKTWVIYPTGSKAPLLNGMKDAAYGALIKQACDDWAGGLPTKFEEQNDGSVLVSIETWDSYRFSKDFDRIEASYVRDGGGWKVTTYKAVIETGGSDEATPTA